MLYEKNLAKVSRVIYNRLASGMPLQMDSTVLYSLGQDGGPVTPADLRIKSPYNTYLNTGLTPTPICFPSRRRSDGGTAPDTGGWLYFTLVSQKTEPRLSPTPTPARSRTRSSPTNAGCRSMADRDGTSVSRVADRGEPVVATIGDPIAHSMSPRLHQAAFDALGLDWVSVGFLGAHRAVHGALRERALGIAGPFGHDAAQGGCGGGLSTS